MVINKTKFALIRVVATLFAFGVISLSCKSPTKTNSPSRIRVGILKHESTLPIYVADELGFFKKRGLDLELIDLPPADHLTALLADRVDVLSPTSFPTLFGVMLQHPSLLYVILPGAEITGGQVVYGLLVKADNPASSIKDLRGGVIIAINPYTKVNVEMILAAAGVPNSDRPEVRVASREAAIQAVSSGTARAAIMDQPALAVALASPGFRLLEANPRAKYIGSPYWSGAGAVKRELWIRRKDECEKFVAAFDEGVSFIRQNRSDANRILISRLGLKPEIADKCGGYYFALSSEVVPKDGIEKTIKALRDASLLNGPVTLSGFFPAGLYGER